MAVRAIAVLLLAAASLIAACGKKGPLYLPDAAARGAPTGTAPTDSPRRESH